MSEISKTGEGLNILIDASYSEHHEWMTLASWYSIRKNLPDAKVAIAVTRGLHSAMLYEWVYRSRAEFFQHSSEVDPLKVAVERKMLDEDPKLLLKMEPDVIAVRPFDADWIGPFDVKESDCPATLVSYLQGCGKFVLSEWIHKKERPFEMALRRFGTNSITVNEKKVFEIWERVNALSAVL